MDSFFDVQCTTYGTPEILSFIAVFFKKASEITIFLIYSNKCIFSSVSKQIYIDVSNSCNLKMPTVKFKQQV